MGRPSETATIYLTSPTQGRKVFDCWLSGYGEACRRWHGHFKSEMFPELGGVLLARDRLAAAFLASGCSHWLNVDSDHLWTVEAAELLIDLDVDLATGIYAKKDDTNEPVLFPVPDKRPDGPWKIETAGAGFQVIKRAAVEKLFEAYQDLAYDFPDSDVRTVALHNPFFYKGIYRLEDIALYCRWEAIGGEAWAHPDAIVGHFDGSKMYWPKWGVHKPERTPLADRIEVMRAPNGTAVLHDQRNCITTAATVAEAQLEGMTPEDLAALRWRTAWDAQQASPVTQDS